MSNRPMLPGFEREFEVKNRPIYSLTVNHLSFMDYHELFYEFYGMHQVEIPHSMGLLLNPGERLAIYLAAHMVKQDSQKHRQLSALKFRAIFSELERKGFETGVKI